MNDLITLEQVRRYNRVVTSWFTSYGFASEESLELVQKSALRIIMRYLNLSPDESDQNQFFKMLERIGQSESEHFFSESQIQSKVWLGKTLHDLALTELDRVAILGGWFGHHPLFMRLFGLNYNQVVSFDRNPNCVGHADFLNGPDLEQNFRFKAVASDAYTLNLSNYVLILPNGDERNLEFDTIVCTSCEHMDLSTLLQSALPGALLVLQGSNNKTYEGHDFAYDDLDAFKNKANLSSLLYTGEISVGKDKRFMVIGRK